MAPTINDLMSGYMAEVDQILARAKREGRANLTAEEGARTDVLFALNDKAKAIAVEEAEYMRKALDTHETDAGKRTASLSVTERPGREATQDRNRSASAPMFARSDGRNAVLAPTERFGDNAIVREYTAQREERDRHIIGQYGSLGQMVRALSTTGSSGVIPQIWANQVVDNARNAACVLQAGAQIVPMSQKIMTVGRLTADPTSGFRAEGSSLGVSDPTFGSITLTAKTLSAQVVGSLEFFQDSISGEEIVTNALGKSIGLELDKQALWGGLLTADCTGAEGFTTNAQNPTGILKNLLTNAAGNVLGLATNGTAITAASPFNEVLDTIYAPMYANLAPNAVLWNAKMANKYAKTYQSTYAPLPQPKDLAALDQYVTNQINSYTRGTLTNVATDVFAGKFDELLVGQRMELEIKVLTERYMELGQVSIVAVMRVDFGFAHDAAFAVYRSLGGS